MHAKDVMTTKVITVMGDTLVEDVARLLLTRRISAVPVVDESDRIVGIVSEGDLMRRAEAGERFSDSWWLDGLAERESVFRSFAQARGRLAKEVMSNSVIVAKEEDSLTEIARLLEKHRIKRVPIVRGEKVIGIVSRANLLHGLAAEDTSGFERRASSDSAKPPGRSEDRSARATILNTIHNDIRIRYPINVIVTQGVVDLWGGVENESQRQAICAAAESAPGIRLVSDHLTVLPLAFRSLLERE